MQQTRGMASGPECVPSWHIEASGWVYVLLLATVPVAQYLLHIVGIMGGCVGGVVAVGAWENTGIVVAIKRSKEKNIWASA